MLDNRREFIKKMFTLCAGSIFISPTANAQWFAEKFSEVPFSKALTNLFANKSITETDKIILKIPTIAENGAVVPLTVTSTLDGVKKLFLLVEKNPVPLAATFDLSPKVDVFVSARLKMAETCDVWAVVETAEGFYSAKAQVKVTIGGCGG